MGDLAKYQNVAQQKGGFLLSESVSIKKRAKWQCNEGHVFWLSPYSVHRRGKWCRECGNSIGERNVRAYLRNLNVEFITECCLNTVPRKRYDFYFKWNGASYLVEFDGEQHFRYVRKYHKSKANFYESQVIDRIKTYGAWKSGYRLIRIDYTQCHNIAYHMNYALYANSILYFSDPNLYKYLTEIGLSPEQIKQHTTF